ncbi:MAG: ATP-binding cassette domain-containing protein [Phreatobacter sp.]|nr:ATP-binding cassette domain-containing protein [Phreatobacter sp.]
MASMVAQVNGLPRSANAEIVAATVVVNVLGLALPIVLLQVYDRIIPRQAMASLVVLGLGLFVAVMLEFAVRAARAAILGWVGAVYEHRMRIAAIRHALACDLDGLEQTSPGRYLELMSAIDRLRERRVGESGVAFVDLPFIVVFLAVIAWVSPILAAVTIGMILVVHLTGAISARRLRKAVESRAQADGERGSFVIHSLEALEPIKSLGLEALITRRYEKLVRSTSVNGHNVAVLSQSAAGLNAMLLNLVATVVGAAGAVLVIQGTVTVGALAACVILAGRAVQPVVNLQGHLAGALQAADYERRYQAMLALPSAPAGHRDPGPIETLTLENVSLATKAGEPLLQNVRLELKVGETIALTGPSGSGKTALLNLLAGLMAPTRGQVLINGLNRETLDPETVRRQVALLPQRAPLLTGTVIENLTCFAPEDHIEEAIELSVALGLDRFFGTKPEGLTLQVTGAGQTLLPSSIAQQVSIVRGLLGAPRIILFDEANKGLDRTADMKLRAYLETQKPHAAIVLVTHRPSYLSLADRRLRIADGGIYEDAVASLDERIA